MCERPDHLELDKTRDSGMLQIVRGWATGRRSGNRELQTRVTLTCLSSSQGFIMHCLHGAAAREQLVAIRSPSQAGWEKSEAYTWALVMDLAIIGSHQNITIKEQLTNCNNFHCLHTTQKGKSDLGNQFRVYCSGYWHRRWKWISTWHSCIKNILIKGFFDRGLSTYNNQVR